MGLEVKDLSKKYGDKVVVDHVSFSMENPGVYALLGTNGAGKTTTIRMILDMLDKDSGEVLWNGQPLSFDNCNIGYLAEERGLYQKYSLMDQIMYFGRLRGVKDDVLKEKIRYWSGRLKLDEYLYPQAVKDARGRSKKGKPKSPDQLSKGNQQKIQFLIAMLSEPELLVLDEPFSGLDPVNTDILKDVVREQIDAGKYIIMSSHQMAAVEEFCTDITIMSRSRALVQGNLNEIKKGYGRVKLALKCEQDVKEYIDKLGITILSEKENEYELRVTGEQQANALLWELVNATIPVIRFDLSELSLHEIFVKEVGADEEKQ
ncbi:MAG: ATP-binding cassette domain-containing protein [Lachnospiraceae bacterium]|nr:ATP-binding cassette domain-containing protein [Lachnospiraceae bacterium]